MARKFKSSTTSGKRILLIDDNREYIEATKKLLSNEGHDVAVAANGKEALELLQEEYYDLVLVDYYMPGMTGEEMVTRLREFNPIIQVILQTGYVDEQPPRELIRRLDIQGYYNKSEGPEKLLLWVDVGLKAAYTIQLLHKSRQGLNYILNVTPDLHKTKSLSELLQGILLQVSGLLGINNSFLAVLPAQPDSHDSINTNGFIAVMNDDAELIINAGTGKYISQFNLKKYLEDTEITHIYSALNRKEIKTTEHTTIIPLCVGDKKVGVIYIDEKIEKKEDIDLLSIFANQAAVAIQNTRLYQIATYDPLTNVYLRGIFLEAFIRELRITYRSRQPLALLLLDIDNMKKINDTAGHLAGDQALRMVGEAIHEATRQTDIRGRIGGDEFAIVLPNSNAEGAENVGMRIIEHLSNCSVSFDKGTIPVTTSIGVSILDSSNLDSILLPVPLVNQYFQQMTKALIAKADEQLYTVKKQGGGRMSQDSFPIGWIEYENTEDEKNAT